MLLVIVQWLTADIQKFSKDDITPYYNDITEKIVETLEETKETIEIYKHSSWKC